MKYDSFQWYIKFQNDLHIADKNDSNPCEIFLNKSLGI